MFLTNLFPRLNSSTDCLCFHYLIKRLSFSLVLQTLNDNKTLNFDLFPFSSLIGQRETHFKDRKRRESFNSFHFTAFEGDKFSVCHLKILSGIARALADEKVLLFNQCYCKMKTFLTNLLVVPKKLFTYILFEKKNFSLKDEFHDFLL